MAAGKKITIEFLGKDSTGGSVSSVEKRFGKLGGKLDQVGQRAGKVLAVGFLAAGAAAVKLGQKASDLAETQSKVAQIFGEESTAALDKFAASAATSLGQSKQVALDGAATFGVLGKSAGLAGTDLVGFSTDMVQLAGDMASFNNSTPEEAIEAIGAGLRGEAEPLRRFGVLLDDATLRTEAMKMGLIKTTKEALTPQQKVLAAQSAILKQTSDQQGDFARTSDGMANKQRILKAQLENMGTTLGAKVLPALIKLVDFGTQASDWASKHSTLVGTVVVVLGSLAAGLYAVSVAMRVMNLVMAANPVVLIIGALIALGVALVIAYKKVEWFRNGVDAVFRFLWNNAIGPVIKLIIGAFGLLLIAWGKMLQGLSHVPGFGWAKKAGDAMVNAGQKALGLAANIHKIPSKKTVKFYADIAAAYAQVNKMNAAVAAAGGSVHYTAGYGGGQTAYASGTNSAKAGIALVGEDGPELVRFSGGEQVLSAQKTKSYMAANGGSWRGGGGGQDIHVHLYIDGKQVLQSLVRQKRTLGRPLGLA